MPCRVGVAIDIDEVGRGQEMGWSLRLLINDKMVSVSHQWTVVRVEKLLLGGLGGGES